MSERDLTQGDLLKSLISMVGPAALGMAFSTLYNVVDTFYAGWISTEAQAGLAVSFSVFMLLVAIGFGLSNGASALIGGALGARDAERARTIGAAALTLAAAIGVALGALGLWVAGPALALIGTPAAVAMAAESYLAILFLALPSFLLGFVANGVLTAQGDTSSNRTAQLFAFLTNAALNPLLIYGAFGIEGIGFDGIAVSTFLTQTGVAIWLTRRALRSGALRGVAGRDFRVSLRDADAIARQAAPASMTMLIMMLGAFIIQWHLQDYGAAAVAGYGVAFRVEQLILLPILSVSFSMMPMVAQNFGAGLHDRVRASITLAGGLAVGVSLIGAAALGLGGVSLVRLFTSDPAVVASGAAYLAFAAFMMPAYAAMFVIGALLQGLRRPVWSVVIGLYRQNFALLVLPPLFAEGLGWGLDGVWTGLFAAVWTGFLLAAAIAIRVCNHEIGGYRVDFGEREARAG